MWGRVKTSRKLAYVIKNSTTIILPRWNEIIEQCTATSTSKKKLIVRKMPQDVSTRWNSTYDMVKFACTYSEPINKITGDCSLKIRQYELKDHEWTIAEQLRDCLKVRTTLLLCLFYISHSCRFLKQLHFNSQVTHPASPVLYLPWTECMLN